jgi:outer membrane protein, heavy metal efflux system
MSSKRAPFFYFLALLALGGCAARRYQPAPVIPSATARQLESRNLADPGLRAFVERSLGRAVTPWPPKVWNLPTLTLAAIYFSPVLDAARARVAEAEAGVETAGARPNPTLSVSPGVPSPYLLSLEALLPVETAGKRGRRVVLARNLTDAARFDFAAAAWTLRSKVRANLLGVLLAGRQLELLRAEEQIRREQVILVEQRLSVGEGARPDVDLARIQLTQNQVAIRAAEGQVSAARAGLAAAIGVPVAGLGSGQLSWPGLDSPPPASSLSPERIQRGAVLNRLDVRGALARYAAAESALRLEIAKQYPDFQVGPGYTYEERNNFFTIGFSIPLPIFNRNLGAIDAAEARRKQAAAAFLSIQAQVIAQSEQALARYRSSLEELSEADQDLRNLQDSRQRMTELAVRAGEVDQLALVGVRLEQTVVEQARLDALDRAQSALGSLEDAVQRPFEPNDIAPSTPAFTARPSQAVKESQK